MKRLPLLRIGMPLLAAGLLAFAILSSTAHPTRETTTPEIPPARSPFVAAVAGLGVVEPNSELIDIGTNLSGVVTAVHVRVGKKVRKGDALFTLDDRDARARLGLEVARLESARVTEADMARQYALYDAVADRRAISQDELDRRRFAVESATKAVREAEARIQVLRTELERLTVCAPIDGTVLRVNVRDGEYASAGMLRDPLMVLGNVEPLHVRVEVDETDIARYDPAAPAVASVRGNARARTPLQFVRAEPLLRPKRTLTGDGNERVDTRVLQVIYAIRDGAFQAALGQEVDVFIDAEARGEGGTS
ncbi:MAG: efflux RND transporter periplasmic adaptor subunit [Betaproteobacteria bacterium]|nr:efflux RND transporter periplasmic adaptor subunit [Betaproteobacteria bacterium]